MTLLGLLLLIVLGLVGGFICLMLLGCALEAAPLFVGLLVCWWLAHAMGCM
jgi:hypothetical protein